MRAASCACGSAVASVAAPERGLGAGRRERRDGQRSESGDKGQSEAPAPEQRAYEEGPGPEGRVLQRKTAPGSVRGRACAPDAESGSCKQPRGIQRETCNHKPDETHPAL